MTLLNRLPVRKRDLALAVGAAVAYLALTALVWAVAGQGATPVGQAVAFGAVVWLALLVFRKMRGEHDDLEQRVDDLTERIGRLEQTRRQLDTLLYDVLDTGDRPEGALERAKAMRPSSIIPSALLPEYTLDGEIPVEHDYIDETVPVSRPTVYTSEMIDQYVARIRRRESIAYGKTTLWLYDALDRHSIAGLSVAILGSTGPHYESVCIAYGGKPTTVEYNKIVSRDPRLATVTVEAFRQNPTVFDAAFSISSFEHDGLGRYGDPLNPRGDLDAMAEMKSVVKAGGLLFLAVPVGRDRLVWNANRIYGRKRLPLLLEGWRQLDAFGLDDAALELHPGAVQPVIVLQNV